MHSSFRATGFGDDVDGSGGCAAAEQYRAATGQNFNAFDRIEGDAGESRTGLFVFTQALAVEQDQGVLIAGCAESAQVELHVAVASRVARVDPALAGEQFSHAGRAGIGNVGSADNANANRQLVERLGKSRGRNDDRGRGLRVRRKGSSERDGQHRNANGKLNRSVWMAFHGVLLSRPTSPVVDAYNKGKNTS